MSKLEEPPQKKQRVDSKTDKECTTCHTIKNVTEFYIRSKNGGLWGQCKNCCQTVKKEWRRRMSTRDRITPAQKECFSCKKTKPASEFFKKKYTLSGLSSYCKDCDREKSKEREETWKSLFDRQYLNSLRSHGNYKQINPISRDRLPEMLDEQNGCCNTCHVELNPLCGTKKNPNGKKASLDRVNTNIIGYGNGNAQWLCLSCNHGKGCIENEVYRTRFAWRDRQIAELKRRIAELEEQVARLMDID